MGMLIDILGDKINAMKELRLRQERRDNKAAQDAVDHRYRTLSEQINQLITALQFAKIKLAFQLSDEVIKSIETLLMDHKDAVRSGYADKDIVDKEEDELKTLSITIKKEWTKRYKALTDATVSTLKILIDIDSDKVSDCLEGIERGENWTTDISEFEAMIKSIESANVLISGLGLDEQIIAFLQKMNSGKATVVDLDEKVINWLKTEALDKKVKLIFS